MEVKALRLRALELFCRVEICVLQGVRTLVPEGRGGLYRVRYPSLRPGDEGFDRGNKERRY